MNENDDYGFWDADRGMSMKGPITRPHRIVRQHSEPISRVDATVNPLWTRLGALCLVGLVAMSLAYAVGDHDSSARVATVTAGAASQAAVGFADGSAANELDTTAVDPTVTPTVASLATPETTSAPPETTTTRTRATVAPVVAVKIVCVKSYQVVAGDYWIRIASRVKVTLHDLLAANGATTKTLLLPGRSVCLPKNASPPTVSVVAAAKPAPAPATTVKVTSTTSPPTPTTAAPPPSRYYSAAEVEQIIRDVWPNELEDKAILIAKRESSLNPYAHNYCCYGLFQIYWNVHKSWLAGIGVTSSSMLFDPRINARAALAVYYRAGGWGPWSL